MQRSIVSFLGYERLLTMLLMLHGALYWLQQLFLIMSFVRPLPLQIYGQFLEYKIILKKIRNKNVKTKKSDCQTLEYFIYKVRTQCRKLFKTDMHI